MKTSTFLPLALFCLLATALPAAAQSVAPPVAASTLPGAAPSFAFPREAASDDALLAKAMPALARDVAQAYRDDDPDRDRITRFRLQMLAGDMTGSIATIHALRRMRMDAGDASAATLYLQYEIFATAKVAAAAGTPLDSALGDAFRTLYGTLDDRTALRVQPSFDVGMPRALDDLRKALAPVAERGRLDLPEALELMRRYQFVQVFSELLPRAPALFAEDEARRYRIERDVWIAMPDGARISAMVVHPAAAKDPLPTLLGFTIYANPDWLLADAKTVAAHGYVGVVAVTRGKSLSGDGNAAPTEPVMPFERDGVDAAATIGWIAKQPWSDGRVGMYGGSYNSFTQWAAAKHRPPALKAMMTSASAAPGIDVPMQGNVFVNFMYPWPFYTTNNRTLDDATYGDQARWDALNRKWYADGGSYRDMDRIDGTPNPVFRRWLQHPGYDAYWQAMIPYREEFAGIDIPVLATTGYFDGGRVGVQYYFDEHTRRNPRADHTLVIGPFGHLTMQTGVARNIEGYDVDPSAMIDLQALRYAWFDHVLRGGPRPELLRDRINHQVMGADVWKHAPSVAAMANASLRLYLQPETQDAATHRLVAKAPRKNASLVQRIDFSDRSDADWDPSPLSLTPTLDAHGGLVFVSDPIDAPTEISGLFSGMLDFVVDKRDLDVTVELHEQMADGRYFYLSHHLGRASYAKDRSRRELLRPGARQRLAFRSERLTSRMLEAGSRLVVVLRVNKQSDMQINYGTGGDVAAETTADAGTPMRIEWLGGSYVEIPVWR